MTAIGLGGTGAGAPPELLVCAGRRALAEEAGNRLATLVARRRRAGEEVHVVLTGGGIGIETLAVFTASGEVTAAVRSGTHLWWGDERFLPVGDPQRNDTQAGPALHEPAEWPAAQLHPVGEPGQFADPAAAAVGYATQLAEWAPDGSPAALPPFAVVLLGIGPEGHVASLFPGSPLLTGADPLADVRVAGVTDSPKPPPERVTLTPSAITTAEEVWILASGTEKAAAVARLVSGTEPIDVLPAAVARGRHRTLVFTDPAAAGR